ncbi:MAG: DUF2934 domain-containing protein [Candidatus Acidiferrales bacterium]
MKVEKAENGANEHGRMKVSIADTQATLKRISDAVARRAYELYKDRKAAPGNDKEDWRRAESEVLVPLSCRTLQLENGVLVQTDILDLRSNQVEVSIEPGRLIIAGKARAAGNGRKISTFRVLNLAKAIDPSTAVLRQQGPILEIELHEPASAREPNRFAKAA